MDLTLFAAFVIAVFLLSLAPGPDMLFVVANGITGGRKAGVVAAVGMSTGLAIHTLAAAFGLGALLLVAPAVLDAVRIAGAVFLVYLAVSTWRSSRRHTDPIASPEGRSLRRVYVMAVLTNLANPKIILFYLAFLPQFLTVGATSLPATVQFLILGVTFIIVGIVVDASAGLLAGTMSEQILRRRALRRWMDRAAAGIFGGLAVRLALDSR